MQLLQRHVLLGTGVRTVVVGRLLPSKGLLLVRRALDESIESGRTTLRRVVCRTPRRVAVRSQHRDATLASDAPRAALLPGTFPYLLMLRAYTALGIECSKSVRGKCRELPTLLGDGRNAARLELGTPVTPAVLGLCRM